MMAPGPYSAFEFEPQSGIAAPNGSILSTGIGRAGAGSPSGSACDPEMHHELRRLLSASWFGSGLRLVWECAAYSADAVRSRNGAPPRGMAARGLIRASVGTAARLALGLAAARNRLNGQHWIIAVTSADALLRSLSHSVIEQLQDVDTRLVLVVFDDAPPSVSAASVAASPQRLGQFDVLDIRWLAELGLAYHGPVDGRNMASVQVLLRRIAHAECPALLHLSTREVDDSRPIAGPTTSHPVRHMIGHANGIAAGVEHLLTAVSDELNRLAQVEGRVVTAVDPALVERFALCHELSDSCHILRDTRGDLLAETCGLALGGCRPFVILSSDLLRRTLEILAREICRPRLPVTFVIDSDEDENDRSEGEAASSSDVALLRLLPDVTILVPRNEVELRQALNWSRECDRPVAVKLPHESAVADPAVDVAPFVIGRAEVLSAGFDLGLLALGSQVARAERVAARLSEQGVSVAVVNARFVQPLDGALLERLTKQVGGLLILEDEAGQGGFGSAVLEWLAEARVGLPVAIIDRAALRAQLGRPADEESILRTLMKQAVDLVERAAGVPALYGGAHTPSTRRLRRSPSEAHEPFGFSEAALRQEQELVAGHRLSAEVEEWFGLYAQAGERRRFLWQWCERGAELTTLPCVAPELFDAVCHTKVLSIMLCVLLDDVADQRGRERFLEQLVKIVDDPSSDQLRDVTGDERRYADITRRLSAIYHARVRRYPSYDDYADLLRYDQGQYFNTMRYSQLLNRNLWLLNPVEHDLYLPHAMDMMSFASIDLMCSPGFDRRELGRLREALWYLQCMGRVGNLLSTWRREIGQHDFTSGVFARAVARGDLTVEDLRDPDPERIEAAIKRGDHEGYYLRRWQYYRDCFIAAAESVQSLDMLRLLAGNERFFRMHLAGRGLI